MKKYYFILAVLVWGCNNAPTPVPPGPGTPDTIIKHDTIINHDTILVDKPIVIHIHDTVSPYKVGDTVLIKIGVDGDTILVVGKDTLTFKKQ